MSHIARQRYRVKWQPPSTTARPDWFADAACKPFVEDGNTVMLDYSRQKEAKLVCMDCPVRMDCLDHALVAREPAGVWGGLTELERAGLIYAERHRGA